MRARLLALLGMATATAVFCGASPAMGQDAARKATAQELLIEGNAMLRASDFIGALVKYEAAHAVFPSDKLLLNIGTTLRHLGRNAEAARAYERYMKARPDEDHTELEALLAEIEPLVGRVIIETSQKQAVVRLDGRKIEDLERAWRLDPGDHSIIAEVPKRPTAVATFNIEAGETRTIRLEHPELPRLVVEQRVEVASPAQSIVGYSLIGLGGAGLVIGGVLAGVAAHKDAAAEERCVPEAPTRCDRRGAELSGEATDLGTGSTISFIAGGALAATGAILLLTLPDAETAVSLAPAPGGGLLRFGGVW